MPFQNTSISGPIRYTRNIPKPRKELAPTRLDESRLGKLTPKGENRIGRCPACAAEGGDETGNHLIIYADGRFGCAKYPKFGDSNDRKRHLATICTIAGVSDEEEDESNPFSEISEQLLAKRKKERENLHQAVELWKIVRTECRCSIEDFQKTSGPIPQTPYQSFETFCDIYAPNQWAWIGNRFSWAKEQKFTYDWQKKSHNFHLFEPANHEARHAAWEAVLRGADHTSGLLFPKDSLFRRHETSIGKRFIVVEHDGLKSNPKNPALLPHLAHQTQTGPTTIEEQLGLLQFCTSKLKLPLLYVVSTAGKGVHGIFDSQKIHPKTLEDAKTLLLGMGVDLVIGTLNTRTPGAIRQPTKDNPGGKVQSIIWTPNHHSQTQTQTHNQTLDTQINSILDPLLKSIHSANESKDK